MPEAPNPLRVVSFGYGHDAPPAADITVDLRDWFRDPHIDPELRQMTGLDQAVVDKVLGTHGVRRFVSTFGHLALHLMRLRGRTVVVAVGCVGGRHRSVVIADQAALYVRRYGYSVEVQHLHVDRPVLVRGDRDE